MTPRADRFRRSQYVPDLETFTSLARKGNIIPVYREILADMETPVSAMAKIDDGAYAYLLESVEGGEQWARYSFLGTGAFLVLRGDQQGIHVVQGDTITEYPADSTPLEALRSVMSQYRPVVVEGLPRFYGGAVGYLSYDVAHQLDEIPEREKPRLDQPSFVFLLTDTLLIFDNVAKTIKVVACVHTTGKDLSHAYSEALERITAMIKRLKQPRSADLPQPTMPKPVTFQSNLSQDDFEKMVLTTKEYIRAGDIVQTVLSQRWETEITATPFDIYRALRLTNPSPYLYYLRIDDMALIGSSPEVLVRCEEGRVEVRPIAGTRPRGQTAAEDQQLEEELKADEKERAEHVMLVDLGRNDVGRVARYGTVHVSDFMIVEYYSHVMHLVSRVEGALQPGHDAFDVIKACFPAGTVSGAPKIRAMQIIEELEPSRRGSYAGTVGYVGFSGNTDTCIGIRTIVVKGNRAYIQAGAGIVADSDPTREFEETCSKAKAMMAAIEMAEHGFP
ncbi:MAG TPA: anthranilate synthase component I [Nitrospirales bacterium]|nr:anthranilate synthase component I [Nitrospirales bacterium]HIO22137.1 anthranilate synthase component I [Nitrospirales bacterium]